MILQNNPRKEGLNMGISINMIRIEVVVKVI
jgi:hypothetical protein